LFVDKAYRVHLKSANGPIDVYLCPDNIDEDTSAISDAAVTEPVTGATDGIFPSDPSGSFTVESQEGRLICYNGSHHSVIWQKCYRMSVVLVQQTLLAHSRMLHVLQMTVMATLRMIYKKAITLSVYSIYQLREYH